MQALQSSDNDTRRSAEAQWFGMVEADEVAVRCSVELAARCVPRPRPEGRLQQRM